MELQEITGRIQAEARLWKVYQDAEADLLIAKREKEKGGDDPAALDEAAQKAEAAKLAAVEAWIANRREAKLGLAQLLGVSEAELKAIM
jgi:hypothetical protein